MGKTNRQITLDFQLNEKLKLENNASELIETLLINHYNRLNHANPQEREVQIARDLELVSEQQKKLKEEYDIILTQLNKKKEQELKIEEEQTQQYLNKKNAAKIRYRAQKEFEEYSKKLPENTDFEEEWEKFYKNYVEKTM